MLGWLLRIQIDPQRIKIRIILLTHRPEVSLLFLNPSTKQMPLIVYAVLYWNYRERQNRKELLFEKAFKSFTMSLTAKLENNPRLGTHCNISIIYFLQASRKNWIDGIKLQTEADRRRRGGNHNSTLWTLQGVFRWMKCALPLMYWSNLWVLRLPASHLVMKFFIFWLCLVKSFTTQILNSSTTLLGVKAEIILERPFISRLILDSHLMLQQPMSLR